VPYYENVMIARQDISAAQVEALTDQFSAILSEGGGSVGRKEYWGLRNLAFRIKKNRKGHYVLINFEAPAAAVQEMERNMRLNEDVLRFMTCRTDDLPETPSVVMQRRDERDRGSRGGRDGGPPHRSGPRQAASDGPRQAAPEAPATETQGES